MEKQVFNSLNLNLFKDITPVLAIALGIAAPLTWTPASWGQPVIEQTMDQTLDQAATGQAARGQVIDQPPKQHAVSYYNWQPGWQPEGQPEHAPSRIVVEPLPPQPQPAPATTPSPLLQPPAVASVITPAVNAPAPAIPPSNPGLDQTASTAAIELNPALPPAHRVPTSADLPIAQASPTAPEPLESQPLELDGDATEQIDQQIDQQTEQDVLDGIAPINTGQRIADIQVRFLNKDGEIEDGHTHPSVFTREFALEPGTVYNQVAAQQGINRLSRMRIVRSADVVLEPTDAADEVTMVIVVRERSSFMFDLASVALSPSGLDGPFQPNPALRRGSNQTTGLSSVVSATFLNLGGNDQTMTVQLEGGETVFNTEINFADPWIANDPTGIALNIFNQRSVQRVFAGGNRDVDLPNLNTPWVHRWGGGVSVFRPIEDDLTLALGVNYQQVSIHNSAFETERFNRDQLGERLIVSDDDFDDLLTVQFSGEFNQIQYLQGSLRPNSRSELPPEPIDGPRLRFGVDQAIPVGDASIAFTRFSANYLYYLPVDLFGFAEGPRTLVLNAQTGFMFGDIPPYEAFGLDAGPLGSYAGSGLASGSRFALAVAEYRFPIVNFELIRRDIELAGVMFSGFASTLGSADEVIGDPSVNRQKPEDGFVGGLGLRARTPFGLFRVEASLNDDGNAQLVITGGGKF